MLDILIVYKEDGEKGVLRPFEEYNDDHGDDVADYDDESNGVKEYLEEFDDILGNEIDGNISFPMATICRLNFYPAD